MDGRLNRARPPFVVLAVFIASFGALAYLVHAFDAPQVLVALLVLAAFAFILPWPDLLTVAVLFLIYINVPAIAHQLHGLPKVVAGSFVLLLAIPLVRQLVIQRQRVRTDPFFLLMILFLGVLLLASLPARDKGIAFDRIMTHVVEGLVVYWLLINVLRNTRIFHRAVWTLLAAGSLLGGLSLYQSVTGSYEQEFGGLAERQLKFEYKRAEGSTYVPKVHRADRADGPLVGNNRYAQIMIVLLPLAYLQFRRSRSRPVRLAAAGSGFLILSGMLLTYSRGGFLALLALVGLAAYLRWFKPKHVLVGALCAALLAPFAAPNLLTRMESISAAASLVDEDASTVPDGAIRGRATAMLAAFHVFLDHPVLGVGPGQYVPFYSVEYQQRPEVKFRDIDKQRRAHSLYLEMAADVGLIGLVSFLAIPITLILTLWRLRQRYGPANPELADIATAFLLSVVAYLITAMFLHLAFQRYYWMIIGLAGAAVHLIQVEASRSATIRPVAADTRPAGNAPLLSRP